MMTISEFVSHPNMRGWELVDGQLVERVPSVAASLAAGHLASELSRYAGDAMCVLHSSAVSCFAPGIQTVRRPSAAAILRNRLTSEVWRSSHCPIAPDIVIESVSQFDRSNEIGRRQADFLSAGVRLMWTLRVVTQTVDVASFAGSVRRRRNRAA
jgi:Uma2 family endonuclease